MNAAAVELRDVDRFRAAIVALLGLQFEDAKTGFLAEALGRRLAATRRGCDGYLHHLEHERPSAELAALAGELTVPETYFFRNIDQFHAFAQRVVPERMRARGVSGTLRILSAGCASGEEAFSVAILLRDVMEAGWAASVRAVDLNPSVLQKAQCGRFSPWSLREAPATVQERWFRHDGRDLVLDDEIRTSVRFEQRNLAADDADLWGVEQYDVVFCRNVIMYFSPEQGRALVHRITRALAPSGFLFLGHAETLRGLSLDFHLCHTHDTFYYQRKDVRGAAETEPAESVTRPAGESPALASLVEEAGTWVEAIQMATDRVRRLVDDAPTRAPVREATGGGPASARLGLARTLRFLRDEHFEDALHAIEALPTSATDDPDVIVLHAVLLTHAGLLTDAEEACRRLLAIDELSAAGHYVLALCREGTGDLGGAVDHDRMAVYLDPRFAMPRLHLGLLARRAQDFATMRRELGHAARLFENEDSSRLLLFSGGFGREALVALCHAEIRGNREAA